MQNLKIKRTVYAALAAVMLVSCAGQGPADPENPEKKQEEPQKLVPISEDEWFTRIEDPQTKVVSYLFKNEVVLRDNVQSNYFVNPSMTDDERFIFFFVSNNEFKYPDPMVSGCIIDRQERKIHMVKNLGLSNYPYMDVENDVFYYGIKLHKHEAYFYKRDLKADAGKEIILRPFPDVIFPSQEDNPLKRMCSHVTLTQDRRRVYLDARINDDVHVGLYNLYPEDDATTGLTATKGWDEWLCVHNWGLDHGQLNPVRDDIALEGTDDLTDAYGVTHKIPYSSGEPGIPDGTYMRMQIVGRGSIRTLLPEPEKNYATHEKWTADGKSVYWCSNGVNIREVETGSFDKLYYGDKVTGQPAHCYLTKDLQYVVFDDNHIGDGSYRGCEWRVVFAKCKSGSTKEDNARTVAIHSHIPAIATAAKPSNLHPDPHPQFVCNDKYIICTASQADGNMHLSITPVDQLKKMVDDE